MKWCLALLSAISITCAAHDVRFSCDVPTTREDGAALEAWEIGGYLARYQQGGIEIFVDDPPPECSGVFYDLPAGPGIYSIAAYDINGLVSEWSAPVEYTIFDDERRLDAPIYTALRHEEGGLMAAWVPTNSDDLLVWIDPSDIGTITESSGVVTQIDDKSGNGLNFAPPGTGPATGVRTQNGLNVLDCDGSNSLIRNDVPIESTVTFMIVAEVDAIDTTNDSIFSVNDANDFQAGSSSSTQYDFLIANNLGLSLGGSVPYTGTPHLFEVVLDYTINTGFLYVDGNLVDSDDGYVTELSSSQDVKIFANRNGTMLPDGAFGDFYIIESADESDRQRFEGYAAHKWGIESNLDAGHPYKNSPPQTGEISAIPAPLQNLGNQFMTINAARLGGVLQ